MINYKVLEILEGVGNNEKVILAEIKGSYKHYAPYGIYLSVTNGENIMEGDIISHNKYVDIIGYPERHKTALSSIFKCISYLFRIKKG